MRNLIFVTYDITPTVLLFAQSLQSICSVYVDTPSVILLVTVFFIIQINKKALKRDSIYNIDMVL